MCGAFFRAKGGPRSMKSGPSDPGLVRWRPGGPSLGFAARHNRMGPETRHGLGKEPKDPGLGRFGDGPCGLC